MKWMGGNTEKFKEDEERLNFQKKYHGIYLYMGKMKGDHPINPYSKILLSKKMIKIVRLKNFHEGAGFTVTAVTRNYRIPQLRRKMKGVTNICH